ncbi:MAG: polyprenyl synthetase family protein [Fimbriimonadaceae bacterium]
MDQPEALRRLTPVIDDRLDALLPRAEGPLETLHAAMRYSTLAAGKRVRPVLSLLSAEAVGGMSPAVLDGACSVELVHAFSLIHDDLPAIDDDDLRRGSPTCHIQFGEAVAILAGDALFALAFEVLALCAAPPDRVVQALRRLAKATGSDGLVGGETVDILSEGQPASRTTVEFIHARKTGALIAAACEIGGILGGGTALEVEALRVFGSEVGLAFQIADDVLNETGTSVELGKAAGSDRHREKATYPAVFGIEAARAASHDAAERGISALKGLGGSAEPLRELAAFFVKRRS